MFDHDCLPVVYFNDPGQYFKKVFYCLSEPSSKFHINIDKSISKFTFAQLKQQNITVQQLFRWSASIDLIEDYQMYLNNASLSLTSQTFYNCTLPRFGPQCQYKFLHNAFGRLTLYEILEEFSEINSIYSRTLTCYVHLECDYGTKSVCLDWTDICDGQINCLNDGIDEKYCWELEINQCNEDEYRCKIGQCIAKSFYDDESIIPDCIDTEDNLIGGKGHPQSCLGKYAILFKCADKMCRGSGLTNSCEPQRHSFIHNALYSIQPKSKSDNCWLAFTCLINQPKLIDSSCQKFCENNSCVDIVRINCPDMIFYPNIPILFGNVYLAYKKTDAPYWNEISFNFTYTCYNTSDYDLFFANSTKVLFKTLTCVRCKSFLPEINSMHVTRQSLHDTILQVLQKLLKKYHLVYNYTNEFCNRFSMYQCMNSSKCISIYRVFDEENDCPYMDDEDLNLIHTTNIINILNKTHYKCPKTNNYVSYHSLTRHSLLCTINKVDMDWYINQNMIYLQDTIVFQHLCDGYTELLPILIDGQNHTDETECQYWPCNNLYTRCNNRWNCPTIEDEFGCSTLMNFKCSSLKLLCVSKTTYQVICLSSNKINDGHIDCLGGTDESVCISKLPIPVIEENRDSHYNYFHCISNNSDLCISSEQICNDYNNCEDGDDEQFCNNSSIDDVDAKRLRALYRYESAIQYFSLSSYFDRIENRETTMTFSSSRIQSSTSDNYHCNLGLPVHVQLNQKNQSSTLSCFCPPNYYGSQCQYQNQRISLALRFQTFSDSHRILFAIVILLIDNTTEKVIHSTEQLTYLSITDCRRKFNVYLLYSTRPKLSEREYAIHIDIYEKQTSKYRASFLYPVQFPFLPVHRLAYLVKLPSTEEQVHSCLNSKCVHGKCMKYLNNLQNYTFCQCDRNWTGKYCNISYDCQCSSDAKCLGVLPNHRSICLCPPNRYGSRYLLDDLICQINGSSTCLNGGQCISDENHLMSNQKFQYVCKSGYSGDLCEIKGVQLNLTFEHLIISQEQKHVFIHFIGNPSIYHENKADSRRTTFEIISFQKDFITMYWSQFFYLVFVELGENNFYLAHVQSNYTQSAVINETIQSSDYYPHVNELFNQTIRQWHLIRQIKYYHLPCQNQSLNLSCFRDDKHLCICYDFYDKRLSNCFEFDFNLEYDCSDRSVCENDGECFQDNESCPKRSMCRCKLCYHGRRCQHRTSGFGLSLESILGSQILPIRSLYNQPTIVRTSFALILVFTLIGLTNGIVSLITFKNKSVCEVGCGLYLLALSILSIISITAFQLKFILLLLTQMTILPNGLFMKIQCHSLDYLIQVCLCSDQWLNACVAIERVVTTKRGAEFKKEKSRNVAKRIIFLVVVSTMASLGHDAYFRLVFVDDSESDNDDKFQIKRIWCIVRYSSQFQIYNSFIHSLHFFGPFFCNIISSIILVVTRSRQLENLRKNQSFQEILRKELQEHKHLLIAPIILVTLALPRLILTYLLKCMESESDAWLYLCIYLVTFIPSMLTFVIFILPSKFYKKLFRKTLEKYRTRIQKRLHLNLLR